MGLSNNDYNYRLVAAADIAANTVVTINGAGKAAVANATNGIGICPQDIKAGERCPVIRGGTIAELVGMTAGQKLRAQANGTLGTAGSSPVLAVVKSEDATTAIILSANLDAGIT